MAKTTRNLKYGKAVSSLIQFQKRDQIKSITITGDTDGIDLTNDSGNVIINIEKGDQPSVGRYGKNPVNISVEAETPTTITFEEIGYSNNITDPLAIAIVLNGKLTLADSTTINKSLLMIKNGDDYNPATFYSGIEYTVVKATDDSFTITITTDGAKFEINNSMISELGTNHETKSVLPTINYIASRATEITGKGVPGSIIYILPPNGQTLSRLVDDNGNWLLEYLAGVGGGTPENPGASFTAYQIEEGKTQSNYVSRRVGEL